MDHRANFDDLSSGFDGALDQFHFLIDGQLNFFVLQAIPVSTSQTQILEVHLILPLPLVGIMMPYG